MSVERAFGLETLATDGAAVRLLPGVDQDVSLQVHVLHEALPAHLAQEAALLVVEADMRVQRLFLGEALPTEAAGERPLTRVDLHVRLQVATLVEGLPAEAAGKWLFAGVDPQVHLQCRLTRKALATGVAGAAGLMVRAQVSGEAVGGLVLVSAEATAAGGVLQVSLHVPHQEALLVKGSAAHLADIGWRRAAVPLWFEVAALLMCHHMSAQAVAFTKLLTTDTAGVHHLPTVLLHVALQRGHVTEGAAALFTFEGLLDGVDTQVRRQVSLLAELLAADMAAVRLLTGVQPDVQLLRQDGVERLPTEGTRLAGFLMTPQVQLQGVGRVQPLAAVATTAVGVTGTDVQDVFEQEAFPLERAATHMAAEALRRARALPLVPGAERWPASLLLPRRSGAPPASGPVAVRLAITARGDGWLVGR